jgi:Bardet-Biedl syndrome 4 protein
VYLEALDNTPDNPEIMTSLALLHLRLGEAAPAYEKLKASLRLDPRDARTIVAVGSVLQDHNDPDQALLKYRAAALATPNSAQLWNNVGMCFFTKRKHVAALACLKRALYLDPFEWIVCFNTGLVFLHTGQYTSAFHHLSAAIALKPDFAGAYAYLAVAVARMGDINNSVQAYEKALALEKDHRTFLNYGITLANAGRHNEARAQLERFEDLWAVRMRMVHLFHSCTCVLIPLPSCRSFRHPREREKRTCWP